MKKECIAMLLAGGQGSRLYALTQNMAKPAVPFGGKYRIIDFPLSNCTNSGIDTVGVLTQYMPIELNDYIGNGQPWNLDRLRGGVHILPPYQTAQGSSWYEGTANAIYQNIRFIERYDPEYIIVLGGDHIYKMNYSQMVEDHKKNGADATIAVLNVPIEEASRFGIMTCDETKRIVDFTEKPKEPKSTLASMGIYVFTWKKLKQYLIENEERGGSKDFGKDIIPAMLENNEKLYAYAFQGYWKDVGTLFSLWEANMDILASDDVLNLHDPEWKIYSRNLSLAPQYFGPDAEVSDSLVTDGCNINGKVDSSIIYSGATIEKDVIVDHSVIMPGAVLKSGSVVKFAIIGESSVIESGARVGSSRDEIPYGEKWDIAVIGHGETISSGITVAPGQMIPAK